ncbi:hypothetical protein BJP36_36675 [Moorena producens JHB]|uniref:Uncharacterized protein n=1 Tax=Moorena producens (strain JHB) TaxID=1454205 RepID=A0A9Q9SU19_MOOP1|nr:hypothetical protein [Moorena producens]WAN69632.1 hypothetical protein BJP36_36675 [Moorena producens JHB]
MRRWRDGEMGEIFIKGNYPDMILKAISANKDCTSFILETLEFIIDLSQFIFHNS